MADVMFVRGLAVETRIGVLAHERGIRQTVRLDLELGVDLAPAAASDALADAVDYAALADDVSAFVAGSDFDLLESLGEAVARRIFARFAVEWLRLTLTKPGAVPAAEAVGITLQRERER